MSTHFLSRINGWTWFNWGLGAQIHVETVSRKGIFIFLAQAKEMILIFLSLINGWIWSNWGLGAQIHVETVLRK